MNGTFSFHGIELHNQLICCSLKNHYGNTCYNVVVLHSKEAILSAVNISNKNKKLQASAHLVGTNQLPLPEDVSIESN